MLKLLLISYVLALIFACEVSSLFFEPLFPAQREPLAIINAFAQDTYIILYSDLVQYFYNTVGTQGTREKSDQLPHMVFFALLVYHVVESL